MVPFPVDGTDADGTTNLRNCLWLGWGRHYYAAVAFSNSAENRRIMIGWMNNWDYANSLPTSPWRSRPAPSGTWKFTTQWSDCPTRCPDQPN
ncbi:hypothetical protein [Arthrobacter sp. MA-N2]|uniref:hypothetical protein n=1 Tax=Arthrobacter sp. MA-N2 TaxID=1101188 RepID=UPI003FA426E5